MRSSPSRSGFSLLEVVIVVVLIVTLGAIAVPMFERMYGGMKLDGAGDQIRSEWAAARAAAMRDSIPYRFAVKPDSNQFRVAPARAEYWPGSELPSSATDTDQTDDGKQPYQVDETIPPEILFRVQPNEDNVTEGDGWMPMATFMPDGSCRENVTLQLGSTGFRPVILELRGLTGSVHTLKGESGT